MKTNYIYVAAVALVMMATGCSDDQLVQIQESAPNGHQVRVTASMEAESRLGITDTGKRLEFTWDSDDVFHVFNSASQQITVFNKEEADTVASSYGTFVGTTQVAYQDGDKLYAVYNKQQSALQLDDYGNVTLDISQQNGKLDDKYQFMYAETTFTEGEDPAFTFQHLVTMLKLNITVPDSVKYLKELNFKCDNLPTQGTLVLGSVPNDEYGLFGPGDLVDCYDMNDSHTSFLTVEGEFVPVDGVVTVYLYVLPVKKFYSYDNYYQEAKIAPAVLMKDNQNVEYLGVAAYDEKAIEAGKTYQLNTEVFKVEPFANEEEVGAGTASNPYEIATADQLYMFMLRTSKNLRNSDGKPYNTCHYRLMNDITLDGKMLWIPTKYYSGTFDGQGFTLKGNLLLHAIHNTGLFTIVNDATIQNLNLDLAVTFDNDYSMERFGLLTARTNNTSIINCVNHSHVTGYFDSMAGLVGWAYDNTKIVACGNTGNLSAIGNCENMGGVVEHMDRNSSVVACYNTGKFEIGYMTHRGIIAGGIVGLMVENGQSTVQSCWSNSVLTIEDVSYDDYYASEEYNIYFGGIVGYQEWDNTILHCYWNEAVDYAAGNYEDASVTGGGTFSTEIPASDLLEALNELILNTGWQFKTDDGTIEASSSIVVPSLPKEDW